MTRIQGNTTLVFQIECPLAESKSLRDQLMELSTHVDVTQVPSSKPLLKPRPLEKVDLVELVAQISISIASSVIYDAMKSRVLAVVAAHKGRVTETSQKDGTAPHNPVDQASTDK